MYALHCTIYLRFLNELFCRFWRAFVCLHLGLLSIMCTIVLDCTPDKRVNTNERMSHTKIRTHTDAHSTAQQCILLRLLDVLCQFTYAREEGKKSAYTNLSYMPELALLAVCVAGPNT